MGEWGVVEMVGSVYEKDLEWGKLEKKMSFWHVK